MLDVVQLTNDLCAIESITGNEMSVCQYVAKLLESNGFTIAHQKLPNGDRANLYAHRSSVPRILLTTHLDTVPPHIPVTEDAEWLFGRGVCDAKGIAAAMICAALSAKNDDVALLFVVGEETISDGAKWAAQLLNHHFDFIIDGEPTDLKLATSMKGALVFELSATGKAGHSAYAESGYSALHQLIADAQRIISFPWPNSPIFGQTTVNIGCMEGGVAPNVHAAQAQMNGVMRLSCSVDEAILNLQRLTNPQTTLKILSKSEPRKLYTVDGFETCQVAFGCDIPHLEKLGTPILFGPGSILDAHTSHERIRKKDLIEAAKAYEQMIRALMCEIPRLA